MPAALRILFVEDNEDDAVLAVAHLRRAGYEIAVERVDTAAGMAAALAAREWDLVLSDFSLPFFGAVEALHVLHASGHDLPFIIVSGTIAEEEAVAALRAGAHDFIVKGRWARLVPAITRELRDAQQRAHGRSEAALRREQEGQFQVEREQAERRLSQTLDLLSRAEHLGSIGSWEWIVASDRVIWSDGLYHILGLDRAAVAPSYDAYLERVHPDDRQRVGHAIGQAFEARSSFELECRIVRPDGQERVVLSRSETIVDAAGQPVRQLGVEMDVTESRQAAQQIKRSLERLAALRAIDQAITGSLDLSVVLNVFLEHVRAQLGVDAADVLLFEPGTQTLVYAAGHGFETTEFQQARPRVGQGRAGIAVAERRIVTETLAGRSGPPSLRTGMLSAEKFVSYYGVPLITKGQVLGVLEIFSRRILQPDPQWLEFLEALAGPAAIAIENASLFDGLQASNQELRLAYRATIEGWSAALDLRDKETEGHSQRVTETTLKLARVMGLSEEELVQVRRGALLHDIGKVGIPDQILLKPGPLTDEEWAIMRQHPQLAHDLLAPIAYLRPALEIPYCHHEKWDGTGYPRGLKGEAIPLSARIFALVDVWDALRSDRPYRSAWPDDKVSAHIRGLTGKHFDPRVVAAALAAGMLAGAPAAEAAAGSERLERKA